MEIHSEDVKFSVHPHAINRFRERSGCRQSNEYIYNKLLEMADLGEEAIFASKEFAVRALLNHSCEEATYLMRGAWVLVIVDDEIKTIHGNEARRWIAK